MGTRSVVLAVGIWMCALAQAQERSATEEVQEALAKKSVTLDFAAVPLEQVLSFMQDKLGVKVTPAPGVNVKQAVTLKAGELPADLALAWAGRQAGARVEIVEGLVLLVPDKKEAGRMAHVGKTEPRPEGGPKAADESVNPRDGSVLVWVPGGTFLMGRNDGPEDEQPVHRVRVQGFWCGKYEVTNKQYKKFLKATKAAAYYESGYADEAGFNGDDQPVVSLTWVQARAYVMWARLRMLTEAEWEYVAAGGKQFDYPTSTGQLTHDLANYAGAPAGTHGAKWNDVTSPVGSFPPNPFGIYDLAGNAWEHVSSMFKEYPYSATDGRENLMMQTGHAGMRVMRGGCWHFGAEQARTTYRHRIQSHLRLDFAGLRVATTRLETTAAEGAGGEGEE